MYLSHAMFSCLRLGKGNYSNISTMYKYNVGRSKTEKKIISSVNSYANFLKRII